MYCNHSIQLNIKYGIDKSLNINLVHRIYTRVTCCLLFCNNEVFMITNLLIKRAANRLIY